MWRCLDRTRHSRISKRLNYVRPVPLHRRKLVILQVWWRYYFTFVVVVLNFVLLLHIECFAWSIVSFDTFFAHSYSVHIFKNSHVYKTTTKLQLLCAYPLSTNSDSCLWTRFSEIWIGKKGVVLFWNFINGHVQWCFWCFILSFFPSSSTNCLIFLTVRTCWK